MLLDLVLNSHDAMSKLESDYIHIYLLEFISIKNNLVAFNVYNSSPIASCMRKRNISPSKKAVINLYLVYHSSLLADGVWYGGLLFLWSRRWFQIT